MLNNFFTFAITMIHSTIKNIIFDLGGVICDLTPERCYSEFQKLGCDIDLLPHHLSHFVGIFQQIDRGTISPAKFCDEMRKKCNLPDLTNQQIFDAWNSFIGPVDDCRLEAIQGLSQHYNIYLLSNTNEIHWTYISANCMNYNGQDALRWFSRLFLSYEMHLEKPEPEIFRKVCLMAGVNAPESLFVDDNLDNLASAKALGYQTLHSTGGDWVGKLTEQLL